MAGRPTLLTSELADKICDLIAEGMSLRQIGELEGMPDRTNIRKWVAHGDGGNETYRAFHIQYTRACQLRAEVWAEDILHISDDTAKDKIVDECGNQKTDHEHVNRSRLRVDSRKWLLSKVLPKIYGDKVTQEIVGDPERPVGYFSDRPLTATEFAKKFAPKVEEQNEDE